MDPSSSSSSTDELPQSSSSLDVPTSLTPPAKANEHTTKSSPCALCNPPDKHRDPPATLLPEQVHTDATYPSPVVSSTTAPADQAPVSSDHPVPSTYLPMPSPESSVSSHPMITSLSLRPQSLFSNPQLKTLNSVSSLSLLNLRSVESVTQPFCFYRLQVGAC
ncbi:unnamed protein product [Lactuca virosa]|uniref:Uncharacterized protein n=1 Tax=Lactuca virosa TaxID=75947 RepID=A0AAU9LXQ9_9ASTR|nr:unnamed protein product [Lactuca virosa]